MKALLRRPVLVYILSSPLPLVLVAGFFFGGAFEVNFEAEGGRPRFFLVDVCSTLPSMTTGGSAISVVVLVVVVAGAEVSVKVTVETGSARISLLPCEHKCQKHAENKCKENYMRGK